MNSVFNWKVSGQVNDVGGSPVTLLHCFTGTWQEAITAGWQEETTPELTDVWCSRVNPQNGEDVVLTNSDGEFRHQVNA